jgi:hypothetical protein
MTTRLPTELEVHGQSVLMGNHSRDPVADERHVRAS